jgi:hypothetical protein
MRQSTGVGSSLLMMNGPVSRTGRECYELARGAGGVGSRQVLGSLREAGGGHGVAVEGSSLG